MDEIAFTPEGERVLQEAENFCWKAELAIVTAEHVFAAALLLVGLFEKNALEAALVAVLGSGESGRGRSVKFGSGGRAVISATMLEVRAAGGTMIAARNIALGAIGSGEISPAFYAALGRSRAELTGALTVSSG